MLRPLVGLTWRKRKYMADAVAVRLTRDPDALVSALGRMGSGAALAPWMAHLSARYVSIPLSMLFTGIPFALLHVLLRALGH